MSISMTLLGQITIFSIVLFVPLLAWMARNRGLSPVAWGMVGVVFPINLVGLFLLLFVRLQKRVPAAPIAEGP